MAVHLFRPEATSRRPLLALDKRKDGKVEILWLQQEWGEAFLTRKDIRDLINMLRIVGKDR